MADFDPCECVFNHETAMRRLLSLLRNSQQGFCTDSECTSELPGPEADGLGGMTNMWWMLLLWMGIAIGLFFLRPKSLRTEPSEKPGPSNRDNGNDGAGPSTREDGPSAIALDIANYVTLSPEPSLRKDSQHKASMYSATAVHERPVYTYRA